MAIISAATAPKIINQPSAEAPTITLVPGAIRANTPRADFLLAAKNGEQLQAVNRPSIADPATSEFNLYKNDSIIAQNFSGKSPKGIYIGPLVSTIRA